MIYWAYFYSHIFCQTCLRRSSRPSIEIFIDCCNIILFFFATLFSKSWKRSVKPRGLSWMEDMTTSSASWHHVWDWRSQSWRTPYWKEIRQSRLLLCFFGGGFLWKPFHITANSNLLEQLLHWTEYIQLNVSNLILFWGVWWSFLPWKLFCTIWQIDRMEQFFAAEGLPHLMFFYQEPEPVEAGMGKLLWKM